MAVVVVALARLAVSVVDCGGVVVVVVVVVVVFADVVVVVVVTSLESIQGWVQGWKL